MGINKENSVITESNLKGHTFPSGSVSTSVTSSIHPNESGQAILLYDIDWVVFDQG